jgi:quinol-cytochrome oxidoreductase complex cytochrome b subunit
MIDRLFDSFARRFRLDTAHGRVLRRPVPEWVGYSYCFGGITFALFCLLLATGVILAFHYVPTEEGAYRSIAGITDEVRLGSILRGMHAWAGDLIVISLLVHMGRVFITGVFKNPRELNWVVGVSLFLFTLAFGFTGTLLPWDRRAYWATVVGTNMVETLPLAGGFLASLLRGGPEVTGVTLLRFYALHVFWLPLGALGLLWAHFHMIRRQGISGGL